MRARIVGGIFGAEEAFRRTNLQETTETLLVDKLPEYGVQPVPTSHRDPFNLHDSDVIHIHHLATGCVRLVTRAPMPSKRGPRIVFTRHGMNKLPAHHRLLLEAVHRRADAVIALTTEEADLLERQGVAKRKIELIHNGLDTELFHYHHRRRPAEGQPWRLLYVGQLIDLKRVHIAIESLAFLRRLGHEAKLDIVSQRPTLEGSLKALAASLEVSDYVRFLPPATREEVRDHMFNAHILCLPSRTEAAPTVVIEAGLTGLPSLAFNVGGVASLLPPGTQLPAIHQRDRYFELLRKTVVNYESTLKSFQDDRGRLAEQHGVDTMVRKHAELYRRLTSTARK